MQRGRPSLRQAEDARAPGEGLGKRRRHPEFGEDPDSFVEAVARQAPGVLRDENAARLANPFNTRRDIDAVAHQVAVAFLDHVAKVDANPEFDAPVGRQAGVALLHAVLHFDCAARGVDNAAELDKRAVGRALDDPSISGGDGGIDEVAAQGPEARERPLFVEARKPAVASDVRSQYCGEPSGLGHHPCPALWTLTRGGRRRLRGMVAGFSDIFRSFRMGSSLRPYDEALLRRAIDVARRSRAAGDHPFGSVLADGEGKLIMEQGNGYTSEGGDRTAHAERLLASRAARAHDVAFLARCTLYTSAEPCAMCAGAIYWAGIGRVVYGQTEKALKEQTGAHEENPTLDLPCDIVFAAGQRTTEVVGPLLEDEAAELQADFWKAR